VSLKTPQFDTSQRSILDNSTRIRSYELIYYENFVEDGEVEFKFRSNMYMINGKIPNGIF